MFFNTDSKFKNPKIILNFFKQIITNNEFRLKRKAYMYSLLISFRKNYKNKD